MASAVPTAASPRHGSSPRTPSESTSDGSVAQHSIKDSTTTYKPPAIGNKLPRKKKKTQLQDPGVSDIRAALRQQGTKVIHDMTAPRKARSCVSMEPMKVPSPTMQPFLPSMPAFGPVAEALPMRKESNFFIVEQRLRL
eukprot:gb/GFBE01016707.1/.p1 GENE.gb/GFBE01016707.1/~~gb/GFBE01016707.1/.p1  ORF type:complete len:139 (+),score=19.26 gb/GFBE01016707.1/:1-417(+)